METDQTELTMAADVNNNLGFERLGGGRVDIHERTFRFAARILKLVDALPRSAAGRAIAGQLSRSGTSVGANVEEAQGSHSRAEFVRRIGIARSEARESLYWVRLIEAIEMLPKTRLALLKREAEEICRILTAIVKTTRSKAKDTDKTKN